MVARADIIAEARSWLGTPYRHLGREKGLGVDCIGLVFGVAERLGLLDAARAKAGGLDPVEAIAAAYARTADGRRLRAALDLFCVERTAPLPGDVLTFQLGADLFQHAGLCTTDGRLVHAHTSIAVRAKGCAPCRNKPQRLGAVIEQRMPEPLQRRLSGVYGFAGIDD